MSLTETEQSAAADLTAAILTTAARNGDEHAAALLGADAPAEVVEAVLPAPSIPTPAAPAATETPALPVAEAPADAPAAVTYEPVLTDELAALLAEPDFEEEAAAEIQAEAEETYIEDPVAATADRAKDKRIKFLEDQLTERSKKNWVAENLRAYPLLREFAKAEVEALPATSRRAFARQAQALNTRLETMAAPMLSALRAEVATITTEARTEARTEVKRAWGDPAPDLRAPGDAEQYEAELAAAEKDTAKTGDLKALFRTMLGRTNPMS